MTCLQQNMLQDTVRTSTYRSAILLNGPKCFKDKKVLDVGAGSGILSYFAVQAGANKVYAVEASGIAKKMKKLITAASEEGKNAFLKDRLEVINGKKKKMKQRLFIGSKCFFVQLRLKIPIYLFQKSILSFLNQLACFFSMKEW